MKTNPNDFVKVLTKNDYDGIELIGLTKREYFAAMAMQGLCANTQIMSRDLIRATYSGELSRAISVTAMEITNALIAELNKES